MSAAQMQLLTAKMGPKDLSALKKSLLRPGFVEEWNSLDSLAAGFAKVLFNKANATPSVSYKLFTTYDPEAVLWLGFTSKDKAVKERYELFLKTWPEARQRIPHAQMQEMRITPELATYNDIVHQVFLQLIDGGLNTPEEIKAFLEPHSPPAPPPQMTIKRTRAKRGAEPKVKEKSFDDEEEAEDLDEDEDLDDIGGDDEEIDLGIPTPKGDDLDVDIGDEPDGDSNEEDDEEEDEPPAKKGGKQPAATKAGKAPVAHAEGKTAKGALAKAAAEKPVNVGKSRADLKTKAEQSKPVASPVAAAKKAAPAAPKASAKPAAKEPPKATAKTAIKPIGKVHAKAPTKAAPPAKSAATKKKRAPAAKPAKAHPAKHAKPLPKKPAKKR
jgi:hypothetical protein